MSEVRFVSLGQDSGEQDFFFLVREVHTRVVNPEESRNALMSFLALRQYFSALKHLCKCWKILPFWLLKRIIKDGHCWTNLCLTYTQNMPYHTGRVDIHILSVVSFVWVFFLCNWIPGTTSLWLLSRSVKMLFMVLRVMEQPVITVLRALCWVSKMLPL